MHVTLADVWRAARARRVPFSAESAGYLVLCVVEELSVFPRRLLVWCEIELMEDGSVRVQGGAPASLIEAERAARRLLAHLLTVASSPAPALARVAQREPARTPRDAAGSLTGLCVELESALIPVNRSAARRALCRLARETARALQEGLPEADPVEFAGHVSPVSSSLPVGPSSSSVTPLPAVVDSTPIPTPLKESEEIEPAPTTPRLGTLSYGAPVPARPREFEVELEETTHRLPEVRPHSHDLTGSSTQRSHRSAQALTPPPPSSQATTTRTYPSARHEVAKISALAYPEQRITPGEATPFWGLPPVQPVPKGTDPSELPTPGPASVRLPTGRTREATQEDDPELEIVVLDEQPLELSPCRVPAVSEGAPTTNAAPSEGGALHACTPNPGRASAYPGQSAARSDVRDLVADFRVETAWSEDELSRELNGLAQVDPSPGPRAKASRR